MPKVSRRFSLRAAITGAATGVVSFTGLTIAADTSSVFLYGAGAGLAALGVVVGSRRLRGSVTDFVENPDLAAGGPRRATAIDSPHAKVAVIHSVETELTQHFRIAKFGLTVVDRLFRDGSYVTSTRAMAQPKVLESAVGERRMATIEEVHRRGYKAWVWTVDDPQRVAELVNAKIDGIITNVPAQTRAAVLKAQGR